MGAPVTFAGKVVTRLTSLAWQAWWRLERLPSYTTAWWLDRAARGDYPHLSAEEVRRTRRSDTCFIFGSGYSLNTISAEDWARIAEHDTIGFNEFHRQWYVRTDYHLAAEVDLIEESAERMRGNPLYRDAVFVLQEGWIGFFGNILVGRRMLRAGARVFRFTRRSRGVHAPPSRSFDDGLVHGFGSICDVVNFAYLMGWKQIVIAGVDLNDRRYFWLSPDEMRPYDRAGFQLTSVFNNADNIVNLLGSWAELMGRDGVSLSTFNPNSRLARVMPVFSFGSQGHPPHDQT